MEASPRVKHVKRPPTPGEGSTSCYCGLAREDKRKPAIPCGSCARVYHPGCIRLLKDWEFAPLLGDDFYAFTCARCSEEGESLHRQSLSWLDVTLVALFNLHATIPPRLTLDGRKYYAADKDICTFLRDNWNKLWLKEPTDMEQQVEAALVSSDAIVACNHPDNPQSELFALASFTFPSTLSQNHDRQPAYDIDAQGGLHELDSLKRKKRKNEDEDKKTKPATAPAKRTRKKGAKTDVDESSYITVYPDIINPKGLVQMSKQPTHSAHQFKISVDGLSLSNEKGYRQAKATHGVSEGHWYFEMKIEEHSGHTRIGWSQISGDLQGPCGYDMFSYSFRDTPGTLFHESKHVPSNAKYAKGYGPGDVIGLSIRLPSTGNPEYLKGRVWDPQKSDYRYLPFKAPPMELLSDSEIRYYKNGQDLGVAFTKLYQGKYHPAVSCYMGGSVTVNFGPKFAFDVPPGARPFCECSEPEETEAAEATPAAQDVTAMDTA